MELEARLVWIRKRCKEYNDSVSRIIGPARKSTAGHGQSSFYYPVAARKRLAWALDSIDVSGFDAMEIKKEISASDLWLERFKKAHEEEYISRLYRDIKALIAGYAPRGSHGDPRELRKTLEKRTDIEILFNELMALMDLKDKYFDGYFEIRDLYVRKVTGRDDELRREVDEMALAGTFFPEDIKEAPEEYWWLHFNEAVCPPRESARMPPYEEKDPEELIAIAEKLLAQNPGVKLEQLAREMLDLANEAKKKGLKVRIYR